MMAFLGFDSPQDGLWVCEGFVSPEDKSESDYVLLPLEVPEGVIRLDVSYEYSDETSADLWASPGNVVDLGVFDSRGAEFVHGRGFRGTSGSSRHQVSIGLDDATPGYLPGPIYPGVWNVMLGLYRIVPQGCHYKVTVRFTPGDGDPMPVPELHDAGVLCDQARWYPGDLHCHTHHSEASGSMEDLVRAAHERGLEFLAITEHNTVSHLAEYAGCASPSLLLIPGEEITTYYGHLNAWGITHWHDFRARDAEEMQRIIDHCRAAGAVTSINHPKDKGPSWRFGPLARYDCIEAWQAYWFAGNYQSLSFWDERLRQGRRVTAVGGSDCHQAAPGKDPSPVVLGAPTTWVYAEELSVRGILDGIRAGHVFVSSDPISGPRLNVAAHHGGRRVMAGDEISVPEGAEVTLSVEVSGGEGMMVRLVTGIGEIARTEIERNDFAFSHTLSVNGPGYVRAEVIAPPEADLRAQPDALWVEALSNPVYLDITGRSV